MDSDVLGETCANLCDAPLEKTQALWVQSVPVIAEDFPSLMKQREERSGLSAGHSNLIPALTCAMYA